MKNKRILRVWWIKSADPKDPDLGIVLHRRKKEDAFSIGWRREGFGENDNLELLIQDGFTLKHQEASALIKIISNVLEKQLNGEYDKESKGKD